MTHNNKDIPNLHAGDALDITCTIEDSDGNTVDLSGAQAEYLLKEDSADADSDALLTKTISGGGITIVDSDAGELLIEIDTNDTGGMVGQKHHRLRVTDSDGDRATVFTGTVTIII